MKKLTSKLIWYDDILWKVIEHYQPTKYDDYLVCLRKNESNVHRDGKTTPIEMILLDCHNDEFYPDIPKVRSLMKRFLKLKKKYTKDQDRIKFLLADIWLDLVRDD